MSNLIAAIFLLVNQKPIPLLYPSEASWTLKNDQTERPGVGKTESWIETKHPHVLMKGRLASLPAKVGKVGFSLIETEITQSVSASQGLLFSGRGTPNAVFSVLVKDVQCEQPEGTLTFQWDFETDGQNQTFTANWDKFVPKIRGKEAPGFKLDLSTVHALSFQISRSQQKKWYDVVPLEFEWEI